MEIYTKLVQDVKLPKMVLCRQHFERPVIRDIPAEIRREFERPGIGDTIKPGMTVAIPCGSRGVSNIALILKTVVDICKEKGAEPFIFPAMGSHGGATAKGQLEIVKG